MFYWKYIKRYSAQTYTILRVPTIGSKWLVALFEKVPGAFKNINSKAEWRNSKAGINAKRNHRLGGFQELYRNVPEHEVLELACDKLYEHSQHEMPHDISKTVNLEVTNVWFVANFDWQIQVNDVVMRAALSMILSNLWLKSLKHQMSTDVFVPTMSAGRYAWVFRSKIMLDVIPNSDFKDIPFVP